MSFITTLFAVGASCVVFCYMFVACVIGLKIHYPMDWSKMKRTFIYIFSIFALVNLLTACSPKGVAPILVSTSLPDVPGPGECTKIGQRWVSPLDGATLVCVPAGEFLMGAGKDDVLAQENEKPQHEVYLNAYWIDRTEVTNINFGKCLAAGACHPKVYETTATGYIPYAIHPDYRDYPAFLYESEPAAEYCQWAGRRLPTEAEWEKAARGVDARLYPWGNQLDCAHANYFVCEPAASKATPDPTGPRCGYSSSCRTTPVDAYQAGVSPYGALNMAGNVWEWVADWYKVDYYAASPANDPGGPGTGVYRVIRGGGAKSVSQDLRVTARAIGEPQHYLDGQIGFRCAASRK